MDAKDVRSKFGSKYDKGIQQMQKHTEQIPAEKLTPKDTQ